MFILLSIQGHAHVCMTRSRKYTWYIEHTLKWLSSDICVSESSCSFFSTEKLYPQAWPLDYCFMVGRKEPESQVHT